MTVTLAWVYGDEVEGSEWSLLLHTFPPDTPLVLLGQDVKWRPHRGGAAVVADLATVAPDAEVVVCAPRNGEHVQGDRALPGFIHPENALYVFGADDQHFAPELLAGRSASYVYVPTAGDLQLHSYEAAMLVLYDRQVKGG